MLLMCGQDGIMTGKVTGPRSNRQSNYRTEFAVFRQTEKVCMHGRSMSEEGR